MHDFLEHIHLEVAVLAAGDRHRAVIAAGAVAAAVLVAQGLELLEAGIPVHLLAVLVVAAGAADALGVKGDAGTGVGHGTFLAVTHGFSPFLSTPRRGGNSLPKRYYTCVYDTPFAAAWQVRRQTPPPCAGAGGAV